jgi:hypothetical protein
LVYPFLWFVQPDFLDFSLVSYIRGEWHLGPTLLLIVISSTLQLIHLLPIWLKLGPLIFILFGFISFLVLWPRANKFYITLIIQFFRNVNVVTYRSNIRNSVYKLMFYNINTFFSNEWFFDRYYNFYINQNGIHLSYIIFYKNIERGWLEYVGPLNLVRLFSYFTSYEVRKKIQTGFIYHGFILIFLGILLTTILFWL